MTTAAAQLSKALGLPANAIGADVLLRPGEPVRVYCVLSVPTVDEAGQLVMDQIASNYVLVPREQGEEGGHV